MAKGKLKDLGGNDAKKAGGGAENMANRGRGISGRSLDAEEQYCHTAITDKKGGKKTIKKEVGRKQDVSGELIQSVKAETKRP